MRNLHPVYAQKWETYARPWYARGVVASPVEFKPAVTPKPMRRHPIYAAKWRAQARPIYDSPPVQPFYPENIKLHIGPNIQPTNPEILVNEAIYMRPWSDYTPYRGWPLPEPARQINV